jgi:hypothetical protein
MLSLNKSNGGSDMHTPSPQFRPAFRPGSTLSIMVDEVEAASSTGQLWPCVSWLIGAFAGGCMAAVVGVEISCELGTSSSKTKVWKRM